MPFEIEDFRDLIRILEARPEWRADLRRLVLTDELLALPEQAARLRTETGQQLQELTSQVMTLAEAQQRTESQVAALAEAQQRTEGQVTVLIEAQNRTDEQIAALTRAVYALTEDVRVLKVDTGDLKGEILEIRYRERAPAYLGRLIRRVHVLSTEELSELLEDAVERGQLTDAEKDEVILTDVVVRGRRKENGTDVYGVVEVSWGVGPHDVERAAQRAALLSKLGIPVLPVVAGKTVTEQAAHLARAKQVWQLTDGREVSPESRAEPSS
jgi:chromosome segregation ATPase